MAHFSPSALLGPSPGSDAQPAPSSVSQKTANFDQIL